MIEGKVSLIIDISISSKTYKLLNCSDNFGDNFNAQNKKLKKQVGHCEIESANKINMRIVTVNPKEYFEKYKDKHFNKKHKGRKNAMRMIFESYSSRTLCLNDHVNIKK